MMTRAILLFLLANFILPFKSHSQCLPQFLYKQGWLGGDNVLSITLAENKTLWIFSDSFVGTTESKDRSSSTIIANTAAISTCKNNVWEIDYFWKKEKNNEPKPIFESLSDDFKYWPTEAFDIKGTLYVALHKVAPKPESKPDDLFNFILVGTTLAEIKDFKSTTPDQWKINYIDWPDVFDPNKWNGAMTLHDSYLYTFIGRDLRKYNLIRVPLNHLTHPEEGIEYFSNVNTWEHGFDRSNAKILLEGIIGGSVQYHQEIGKWVMVYGPEFLSNEIQMRTADEITGPWSKSKVIYFTPQQVPGKSEYHPSFFSYGAREHFLFFNKKTRKVLITYDCNSSDFTKLVNTMEIYTPKIITVPIPE